MTLLNANREHEYQLRNNNDFIMPAPRIEFFRKQHNDSPSIPCPLNGTNLKTADSKPTG